MDTAKRKRIEETGWKVGSATEFLNLTVDEAASVELEITEYKPQEAQPEKG